MTGNFTSKENHQSVRQVRLNETDAPLTRKEEFHLLFFMFEFPCIVSLYYIRNQQDETLAVSFISHCKITVHVSDVHRVHHQEYINGSSSHWS
jgi:hypothetical protein